MVSRYWDPLLERTVGVGVLPIPWAEVRVRGQEPVMRVYM